MLHHNFDHFELPNTPWSDQPDPAELAALEDIKDAGWFSPSEPVLVSLLELVDAVSEVSETQDEVLATVAYMLESGSVVLLGDEPLESPLPN